MPAKKIILIHGLNNNMDCFYPLRDKLKSIGYEVEMLCLPGHGEDRQEAREFEKAQEHFDNALKKLINEPYVVIAFSQGALYFQLWLEKNNDKLPLAQVLLAPALFIRHFTILDKIMSKLPHYAFIPSQMPRNLRRYSYLNIWEYRTLFNKAREYQKITTPVKIPTLILIAPKDELVDSQKLKSEMDKRNSGAQIEFYDRKYLRGKRPGKYHIIFHPDYFTPEDWENFIGKITSFFNKY